MTDEEAVREALGLLGEQNPPIVHIKFENAKAAFNRILAERDDERGTWKEFERQAAQYSTDWGWGSYELPHRHLSILRRQASLAGNERLREQNEYLETRVQEYEAGRHPDDQYLAKLDEVERLRSERDYLANLNPPGLSQRAEALQAEVERLREERPTTDREVEALSRENERLRKALEAITGEKHSTSEARRVARAVLAYGKAVR